MCLEVQKSKKVTLFYQVVEKLVLKEVRLYIYIYIYIYI